MLLQTLQRDAVSSLLPLYPEREARSIVQALCSHLFGTASYTGIVDPRYDIPDTSAFDSAMSRLRSGEPLQYVTGKCDFYSHTFNVAPGVLIPRPETEILCREAIGVAARLQRMRRAYGSSADPVRVLDLCTGSGCIAWTVALEVPGVEVVATDISPEALAIAESQPLKAPGVVPPTFVEADIFGPEPVPAGLRPFDIVLSNPPYILESERPAMHRNVLDWEPESAIFAPEGDPLAFYRAVAATSRRVLVPGGGGIVEINPLLAGGTLQVFAGAGFRDCRLLPDLSDRARFVGFRLADEYPTAH